MKKNLILSIETSCDETSVAIIKNWTEVLSLETATSIPLHQETKWVIPEVAARAQMDFMIPVFNEALKKAGKKIEDIDAIAVTKWPWLVWSLMVWISLANTLWVIYKKPLLWVHHIHWHIFSNLLERDPENIKFPNIVLTVSWGHNDIYLWKSFNEIELIWESLDDSAGEAFDKCWRMIWLDYPAWAEIWKLSEKGDCKAFSFPRPMLNSWNFNFSFSWIKTAFLYKLQKMSDIEIKKEKNNLASSLQEAICETLAKKVSKSATQYQAKEIYLAWWVSANKRLRELVQKISWLKVYYPKKMVYCTDNSAMIWAAAFFQDIEAKDVIEVEMR